MIELIVEQGVVPFRDIIERIAGGPLRGSWWGHPKGKEIYGVLVALEEHPDVRSCKLIDGKQTFVHRRLWPPLLRVARERRFFGELPERAANALPTILAGATQIPADVRRPLELALLVYATSEHTDRGNHESRVVPFETAFPEDARQAADALPLEEALAALRSVGVYLGDEAPRSPDPRTVLRGPSRRGGR